MSVYLYFPVVDSSLVEVPQIGINAFLDEGDNNAAKYVNTLGDVVFFATSNNPFSIGDSVTPITIASGASGFSVYVTDIAATGITSSATTNYLFADGNNGGLGSFTQFMANFNIVESLPASDITRAIGGYNYAIADLGSKISTDLVGVYGVIESNIAAALDTPTQYIAGVVGVYTTNGANPSVDITQGFKAGVAAIITGEGNTAPDAGVLVHAMSGVGSPGTVTAAFKAVSRHPGRFSYGLDFFSEIALTPTVSVADVRLSTGALIITGAGAPVTLAPIGSIYLRTDGANADELLYVSIFDAIAGTAWVASVLAS